MMSDSRPTGDRQEPGQGPGNVGLRPNGTQRPNGVRPPAELRPTDADVTPTRERRPWSRSLALAVALAVAVPVTWWAVTRHSSLAPSRAPAVTSIPFSPVGDAYVSSARPDVNTGSSPVLRTASRPKIRSYITFSLTGLSGTVTSARLRLWSNVADLRGAAVHAVDRSWNENSITNATAPAPGGTVAQTGMVSAGAWVTVDVTPLVLGNGLVRMALTQVGSGSGQYDSREGAHPPVLVVRTSSRVVSGRSPAAVLSAAIDNVPRATGRRYAARDDHGRSMDTLKIIPRPGGGYLGVYHSGSQGAFRVYVAESRDLLHWTSKAVLDNNASQPTIAVLSDSGYLLADEASGNHAAGRSRPRLRFRYYASLAALLAGRADRKFEAPHFLAPADHGAEGTPNIVSAVLSPDLSHSRIVVGFHYTLPHQPDRPGLGALTNFSSWTARPDTVLAAALRADGISGSIGDRDTVSFLGASFELVEAQPGTGPAWHVYLYDERTRRAVPLQIRTNQGSRSFGNPTVTSLREPSGAMALVFTLFLREQFAASGETGELIYYRTYSVNH
jgi:hypothetical protein